jgi:hypothetical protein
MVYTRTIDEETGKLTIDISPEEEVVYTTSQEAAEVSSFNNPMYYPGFLGSF